ncbi:MAG TPA: hypothetical protein VNF73_07860 [Candidatus Saccharimonadales bacterium]|nr:hypothetical protein [Candidatus Saccharimonadales bacterium]
MSTFGLSERRTAYAGLARGGGGFAMVALDQRGSLDTMLRAAGQTLDQAQVDGFRASTVRALAPLASAVLLERGFLGRNRQPGSWPEPCGLIVAADELVQRPDQPVEDSRLDRTAVPLARDLGAQALKLLVLWYAGESNAAQAATVDEFVELAHDNGMLALVEGIVRPGRGPAAKPPSGADLIDSAVRFSRGADIYKAQVPVHDGDAPEEVERLSRELTARLNCPWVVLSTGITSAMFPSLVAAACRGGASGFLAGRAIWSTSLGASDTVSHLVGPAADGLRELVKIVDAEARPWPEAVLR